MMLSKNTLLEEDAESVIKQQGNFKMNKAKRTNKANGFGSSFNLGNCVVVLALMFVMAFAPSEDVFGEGSYQVGMEQRMFEYGSYYGDSMAEIDRPIYVDILTAGEVINVSLAGLENTDVVRVEIYAPSSSPPSLNDASLTPVGALKSNKILDDTTTTGGKVLIDAQFDAALTKPYRFVTTAVGVWEVRLFNNTQNGSNPSSSGNNVFKRFDITVTADTSTDPNPKDYGGRVYAYSWAFNAKGYGADKAADSEYYTVAGGGFENTYYIWKLALDNLAGYTYEIVGNNLGVDSPNPAGENVAGLSVPMAGNAVSPLYPIYLSYPAKSFPSPTTDLTLTYFSFIDNAGIDSSISPGATAGVQDSGVFKFDTNIQTEGVYSIIINTNGDSDFGVGDVLLMGEITGSGDKQVPWDGKDNSGAYVPTGSYTARLEVRTGEFHFVATDVETSGGGSNNGLTIHKATSPGGHTSVYVFWDDITKIPPSSPDERTTTLPDGTLEGKHTWGKFESDGFGNEKNIDTYVYGAKARFTEFPTVIISEDDTPASTPPTAVNDSTTTTENTAVTLNIVSNDTDPVPGNVDPATVDLDPSTAGIQTSITVEKGVFTVNNAGEVVFTPNPGVTGQVVIPYTVNDNDGATSNQANITITINPNQPPVAVEDSGETPLNTPVNLTVVANDTDSDGTIDNATVDLDPSTDGIQTTFTKEGEGTFTVNPSGEVTFTPVQDFMGTSTIPYTVNDNLGKTSAPANITIEVKNMPPVAQDDEKTTKVGVPVTLNAVENDNDPDGSVDQSSVDLDPSVDGIQDTFTKPGEGTFTLDGTGNVTFTPLPTFVGTSTIPYTVKDNLGEVSAPANIKITVENDPPVAVDDSTDTPANTPVTFSAVGNDSDPDGSVDPASVDLDPAPGIQNTFTKAGEGTFTVDTSGNVTFTPEPTFTGTSTIPYTVNDDIGLTSNTANLSVTVAANIPPVAEDDSTETPSNTPVTLTILENDNDEDGELDPIAVDLDPDTDGIQTEFTKEGEGTFTVDASGVVTFTPVLNFVGITTIPYTVNDDLGLKSNAADITIEVVNQPPVAADDSETTPWNTPITLPVIANDSDSDGFIDPPTPDLDPNTDGFQNTFTVPGEGTFTVNETTGEVTFTPEPTFAGTSSIPYTVKDNLGAISNIANISVTVENGPPVAEDDSTATRPNTPVSIPVLTNDSDPNNDPLTLEKIVTQPENGTVSFTPDGTVIYTPNGNFTGTDTFVYEISDGNGGTDTATVTVVIDDTTPTAVSDSAVTPPDTPIDITVLANDSDPEGQPLTVKDITEPSDGTVNINDDGTVTYTPNPGFVGTDTFVYTITDPDGHEDTAVVTVVVNPEVPDAVDDTGRTPTDTPISVDLLENDSDPDGDPLTVTDITEPANGTVTDNGDGTVTYTPNPGFSGPDTFTYKACDDDGNCDIASVTITVENAPPVAEDDSTATRPNTPVSVPVLTNDSDPNNDPLTLEGIVTPPQNGTVTSAPDGTVIYTPNGNFTGTDTFVYEISDGKGGTDTATVTVVVDDTTPTAVADSAVTPPDTPVNITVLNNDTDPEGQPLTVTDTTPPVNGTVTGNPDGTVTYTPNPGFVGTDTFTYTITDPDGHTDTATVTVVVNPKTPKAEDDTGETPTDTPVTVNVLENDSDPNDDPLTVTGITEPGNGTVTDNGDGTVTYEPDPGFSGPDTFTYTVCDDNGNCDTAAVTVTVKNAPPVAEDDSTATRPNTPVSVPVLTNDSDPNHDPITIERIVTPPENGTVSFDPDGTLVYTPNGNFVGTDTFVYEISDGKGGTDTATVTVVVDDTTPTAVADSAVTQPETPVNITVLNNDSDPEGDPLTVTDITEPDNGTVTKNPDGTVTYTPEEGFTGTDTFTYTITDPDGHTDTATVTVVVNPKTPKAEDDTEETPTDTPVTVNVLENDTDPNGDPLTVTDITEPGNGTVTDNGDGTVTYEPDPGFSGPDTFTYTVCDDNGNCDTAAVTVTVENAPPVAENDSTATRPNTPVSIPVLTNDSDPNHDPITIERIVTPPENGTVSFAPDGTLVYTPNGNFVGTDTFVYEISDGKGGADTAVVTIIIDEETPTAVSDSAVTPPDSPIDIPVTANDTDPDSETPVITEITQPENGTVEINEDGTVTYTPDEGFTGTDTFTYTITDPEGNSETATVTVIVDGDIPNAGDDTGTTPTDTPVTVNVLENDTDPNGDPLTVTDITEPGNGTVTDNGDGTVTYTPDPGFSGPDTFTYTVCDDNGNCDTAAVTVTVENAPPEAMDDSTATRPNTPVSIPVLTNDSDPNDDPLTVTDINRDPENGTVTFTPDGTVVYLPNPGFTGTDTFEYTISDGNGGTDVAVVTVKVDEETPVAVADSAVTKPAEPVRVAVLANDSDPMGDPLTVKEVTEPENGTVEINEDGTVTYTPNDDFVGKDTFVYTIEDPDGNTDTAVVTVVVNSDTPNAVDDAERTPGNTPVTIPVLDNDSDPNDDPLTIESISQPANGTAEVNEDGTVTYTPNRNYRGTDIFTYTMCDDNGNCDIATVSVTVENLPPVAEDDSAATPLNTPVSVPVLTNDSDPNGDPLTVSDIVTQPENGTVSFTSQGTVIYTPNGDFAGTDTFEYEISDGHGGTDIAVVTIIVDDHAPTAVADSAVTKPEEPVIVKVSENDTDPDGDPLTVTKVTKPENGKAVIKKDGTIKYTPEEGFVGTDTFVYTVEDPEGNTDTAIVTVVVDPDIPDAVDDTETTEPKQPVTLNVIKDDSDPNGDELKIISISQPGNGTATDNGDGIVTYTPDPGFRGTDTFTYTVCDIVDKCDIAAITVTVENAPPVAEDDSTSTPPNTPVSIPVLTNDSDPNNDPLIIEEIISHPENGTVSFTPDGTAIYTPNGNFTGTDTFEYKISDGNGGTDTAVVTIVIDEVTPAVIADSAVTPPETPIEIEVLNNDTDPDGTPPKIVDTTEPEHGTVEINEDGTVTYTPEEGFEGIDTFEYVVEDEDGNRETALVTVVVDPYIPNAVDNTTITDPATPVTIDILADDVDPNDDPLSIEKITKPANGTVEINEDDTVTYTPDSDFGGTDTFTYTVCDDNGNCDIASVTVIIKNAPPVAVDDSTATPPETPVSIPVLTNDSDPNNDPIVITEISRKPENGTVSFTPEGQVIYTPDQGFTGTDTFEYTIADDKGATDTAVVTITVDENTPTAVADSAVTPPETPVDIRILANDTDPDDDPLEIVDITEPANGKVKINEDGTVTYTPNQGFLGTDTFVYIIEDPEGHSDTAMVTVVVSGKIPQAVDDVETTRPGNPVTLDVISSDIDPNGDSLTVVKISQPANGIAEDNGDGTVTYTPNEGFIGTDTFTYTVCDDNGNCDIAAVTVNIENEPPVAADDSERTPMNTPVEFSVLPNDSDPNDDPLTVTGVSREPKNGRVEFLADGTAIYTPNRDFIGTDTFDYVIDDGNGATDIATVTITVFDTRPVAGDDETATPTDTPVIVPVLENDRDPNNDPLRISDTTPPENGNITPNADGTMTYTPDIGFAGTDSFSYTVCNDYGICDTATVAVTVENGLPVARDDSASTPPDTPVSVPVLISDTDPNNHPLRITEISRGPENGTVAYTPEGMVVYTPNQGFIGTDTFEYAVEDGHGGTDTAFVTITVNNDDPTAVSDRAIVPPSAGDEDVTTPFREAVFIPVLENDSDPNGDTLRITEFTDPENGMVFVDDKDTPDDPTDDALMYLPNSDFAGTDSFEYTIDDGHGGTDTATVVVTVIPDSPNAEDDMAVTKSGTPTDIAILDNDSDPIDDELIITGLTQPANGSVVKNEDGTVTYTPDPGFVGTDTFTYVICNTFGKCDMASVIVTVENSPPVPEDDEAVTLLNTPMEIPILENDSDPDGNPIEVKEIRTEPENGTVALNPDGTVIYTPNPGFVGEDRFEYVVCDNTDDCDTAWVTVTVEDVPPVAEEDMVRIQADTPTDIPVLDNDGDPNDDPIYVSEMTQPFSGIATLNPDDTIRYTPNPGFVGTDTFEYTVCDAGGKCDTATVTVNVENEPPDAVDDHRETVPDTPIVISVLENDKDPDGDALSIVGLPSEPTNGSAVINDDGTITYTPNPGFEGQDTFEYTIDDGHGATDTATVTVSMPHVIRPGSVSGTVFDDLNGDGIQNEGEKGIPGVSIILTDSMGREEEIFTTQDGSYAFTDISPGDYTLEENDPQGFESTTPNTLPIEVAEEDSVTADFGDHKPDVFGTLSGTVFDDLNGDGVQNDGENGIPGVSIILTDSAGNTEEVFTSDDGSYVFAEIPAGDYTVRETDPEGFASTTPNEVSVQITSEEGISADFGDRQTEPGSISGKVFEDTNQNGTYDEDEMPLPGVRLYADLDENGLFDEGEPFSLSDENGDYHISDLPSGNYVLRPDNTTLPEGYKPSTRDMVDIDLDEGEDYIADTDFGYQKEEEASAGGYVWHDADRDGIQGMDETGIAGVTVNLRDTATNEIVATVVSDGEGSYEFGGLLPGNYLAEFAPRSGYGLTGLNQGDNDKLDSDADQITGISGTFSLPSDGEAVRIDAGMYPLVPDLSNTTETVRDINGEGLDPGDILWYSVTIYNSGTAPAENVVYTDIPGEHTSIALREDVVPVTSSQGEIGTGNNAGDEDIRIDIGTIPPGESVVITYLLQIDQDTPPGTWIADQGVVSGAGLQDEPADFVGTPATNDPTLIGPVGEYVSPNVSLSAMKAATDINGDDLMPGDRVRYQVTVTNNGPDTASNVVYNDSAPVYTGLVKDSVSANIGGPPISTSSSHFSLPIGDLAPGESVVVEFEVIVNDDAPQNALIASQGVVTGDGNIQVLTDNPLTAADHDPTGLTLHGFPMLDVYKTVKDINRGSVNPGDILEYTITILSVHGGAVPDVMFYDQPGGFISLIPGTTTTSQGEIVSDSDKVEVEVGNVAYEKPAVIRFQVKVEKETPEGSIIPNQGWATAPLGENGERITENSDDPSTLTIDDPTVVIVVHDPYVFDPPDAYKKADDTGENVIYWEMLWINDKNADAMLVHLEDELPEGLIYMEDSVDADYGNYWYEEETNTIMWEGYISGNCGEVHIWYHTQVPDDMNRVENQACAVWDQNGDGNWEDDADSVLSEVRVCTDDPSTSEKDPTIWKRACGLTLGAIIWEDMNRDESYQSEEPLIDGVKLSLYQDTDGSGDYTPGTDEFVGSADHFTADDAYWFGDLCRGDYFIRIESENFDEGRSLNIYESSSGNMSQEGLTSEVIHLTGQAAFALEFGFHKSEQTPDLPMKPF